jgi:hypothetical protein
LRNRRAIGDAVPIDVNQGGAVHVGLLSGERQRAGERSENAAVHDSRLAFSA